MNRLLFLWIIALLLSTRTSLAASLPATEYDQSQNETKVAKTNLSGHEEFQSASASFFPLGNLLQRFMRTSGTLPYKTNVKANQSSVSVSAALNKTEKIGSKESLPEASNRSIEGPSASENSPHTPKKGSDFISSIEERKQETSVTSASFSSSSPPTSVNSNDQLGRFADAFRIHKDESSESKNDGFQISVSAKDDDSLLRLKPSSHLQLDREEMLISANAKKAFSEEALWNDEKEAFQDDNKLSPVSRRIREYAVKESSVPAEQKFVTIGDADVPREKVALVGDVDGNKFADYIVMNVAAKNYSGTVRLYLMAEDNKFLYTRDLVPGKWGFEHSDLNPGDRYGANVFRLSSAGDSSQCFIAITAPGDRTTKDTNGAVYILELSPKGNVKNHSKLSAKDFLELVEEQKKEERKPSVRQKESEKKYNSSQTQGLEHLEGVTSMVFLNASGGVKAFINVKSPKDEDLLHNIERHLAEDKVASNTPSIRMNGVLSRMLENGSCLYNQTHCDCKLESPGKESEDCYEVFESKEGPGRLICLANACPPSYRCSCDGGEICRKMEETQETYVPHGKGRSGEVYCSKEKRVVAKIVPLTAS